MDKRVSIVQKFCTFLSFSASSQKLKHQWLVEAKLERNIQKVQMYSIQAPEFWARHFLKIIQGISQNEIRGAEENKQKLIAEEHLSAYLQEACYWAAHKIQNQFYSIHYKYSLEDLFQIGNLVASKPDKLLRNFNLEYQNSLENYAKVAILRYIRNEIYVHDIEAKRKKYSNYGLLKDLCNKELKEALALQGINTNQFDLYCLARQCFDIVCQPKQRQGNSNLESPKHSDLIQIVNLYNQQINQLELSATPINIHTIQGMLSTCILAARNYRTKRILPLKNDEIFYDTAPTPWNTLIQIEEREQIQSIIENIFIDIPDVGQIMFKLWLGLDVTQTEIATILKKNYPKLQKQYQVARKLSKYNQDILKSFVRQWNQLNPEILLNEKNLEVIQHNLNECLQSYCKHLLYVQLEESNQKINFLENKQAIVLAFQHRLEYNLNLQHDSLEFVNIKISNFVDEYLRLTNADNKKFNCFYSLSVFSY